MVQKLGVYDFLANLIPGLAFLWALSWLAQFFGHGMLVPVTGSLGETSVLMAWAFILGLLIQGVGQGVVEKIVLGLTGGFPSSKLLLEGESDFSSDYRAELKKAIGDYFAVPVEPNLPDKIADKEARKARLRKYQELFYLCYNLVDQRKLSDRPLTFNAHYGLFRALLTLSLLLLIVFSSVLAWKGSYIAERHAIGVFAGISIFLIVGAFISFFRMKKRGEDFARSIYDLFFAFYRQEKSVQK